MNANALSRILLLLALALPAVQVSAQAQSNVRGALETIMIDDNYIVIDGKRLVVREADLVITYKGEPVRASLLSSGMTVMYSTRADGSLSELVLIGPAAELDQLNAH